MATRVLQQSIGEEMIDCPQSSCNITSLPANVTIMALKRDMYAIAVPIIVVICILVMLSNGMVLFAARRIKNSTKEHPTLPLTLSLATSDLWTSVIMAFSLVHNSYLFHVFRIKADACVSLAFEAIRTGGFITGSLHLLALALIHYLTLRYPTSYQNVVTSRTNWLVILFIWLCPPAILLIIMASLPGQFFRSPYKPNVGYCQEFKPWVTIEFRMVIFFAFFSPFILTSLLYVMFLILFRRQEKKFRRIPTTSSSSMRKQKNRRQQLQKSRRTFITTVMIWLTFFLGWIPSCALFILTCETCPFPNRVETLDNVRVMFMLGVIGNLFILCKSLINPIIYAIRIPEIKLALRKQYGLCAEIFSRLFRPENERTTCEENMKLSMVEEKDEESHLEYAKRNRAPKNGEMTKEVEIEKRSPQEYDNLLKNNEVVRVGEIDCEIRENSTIFTTKAPLGKGGNLNSFNDA